MLIKALSRISPAVAIGSSWERMSPRRQTAPVTAFIVRRTRWIVFPTAPKGRFFFHFSCHLSKIIWKTKKEEPRMCPESLKTHDAVPLFHFAGIRLFRQAFPISVHDLHRRQRRLGSAGALLSCGSLRCTGRLCLPSRQAEL